VRSLRSRLLAAFLLPTLGLFVVAGLAGYALSRGILEDELGRSLTAIAATAASRVNGERLLTIDPGADEGGSRTYRNVLRELTEMRDAAGARRLVAFDREGRVRADAGGGLPVGAEVPELARDRAELERVFSGQPAASQVLFQGSDGRWYKTGYAPILRDGQAVGAIAVEGSAAFFGPLQHLYRAYAGLAAGALLLLGLVSLLTARGLAAPLRRLVAAALRIGRGDLATPVALEKTLEIGVLSRELELMRQALDSRDRQLKMMLAGVAHEVRNPLGGIELFSGLLSEEVRANEEARSHVGRIQREVDYLRRIVEDFLSFAREHKLSLAPIEAGALMRTAGELVRADAEARGVPLTIDAGPATLEVDQSLVVAALVNLLKNAVQASAAGQPVELRGAVRDGRYAIEVQDEGPGVPPEARERIFEPFFTTREKGTGLGLPLARKIVQAHQGELAVESAPGRTIFRLTLPRARP
jgi:signal transduction histidine kinase